MVTICTSRLSLNKSCILCLWVLYDEYKKYLQTKDPQQHIKYKKLRAEVRKLTRKTRRDDWNKYVKSLECDITGPQRIGFKILKKLRLEVNDQIQTNLISHDEWKAHYSKLWFNPDIQAEEEDERT
jgi:hypothetical protein